MSVLDLHSQEFPPWKPSPAELEERTQILSKFDIARDTRNKPYRILNGRSLEQYWNDSEDRWLSNIPNKRRKPWQSAVVKPITRNKCIGIIANLLDQFIEPSLSAELDGEIFEEVSQTLEDLLEHANEKDRYVLKMLLLLVETVSKGTAFLEESYVLELRKIKDVLKWDPLTGEMKYNKKEILDFEGFRSSVIDPREIYLGNIFEFDLQKQPYIFRRQILTYQDAKAKFREMPNWKHVSPGVQERDEEETGLFFEASMTEDLERNEVEVLSYWSKYDDAVAIIIQGIMMTKPDSPIPYTHKSYPFAKSVFEVMSSRFAYGKSLPDRLQGEQDIVNTMYRMIIDKTFLSIFPPLLAKGFEKVTTDIIQPGKITAIDTEGDIAVPAGVANGVGNELQVLGVLEGSMDSSSIDPQHLGTPATGERSATQTNAAQDGAQKVLGMFGFMIAFAIEDITALRVQNILQFWTKEQRMVLDDGKRKQVENLFQVPGRELRDGSVGTREIKFMPSNQQPSSIELRTDQLSRKKKGKNIEIVVLDPDKIRNFDVKVKIKANPSQRMSPALKKVLGIEFYNQFAKNEFVDQPELIKDTMKLWDKDPAKLMKKKEKIQQEQKAVEQAQVEERANESSQKKGNITSQLAATAQPNLQEMIRS